MRGKIKAEPWKEEKGAVMVEASIYFPFVILVIFFIIVLSLVKLQQIASYSRLEINLCKSCEAQMRGEDPMNEALSLNVPADGHEADTQLKKDYFQYLYMEESMDLNTPVFVNVLMRGSMLENNPKFLQTLEVKGYIPLGDRYKMMQGIKMARLFTPYNGEVKMVSKYGDIGMLSFIRE